MKENELIKAKDGTQICKIIQNIGILNDDNIPVDNYIDHHKKFIKLAFGGELGTIDDLSRNYPDNSNKKIIIEPAKKTNSKPSLYIQKKTIFYILYHLLNINVNHL